jgi:hypothetical protein
MKKLAALLLVSLLMPLSALAGPGLWSYFVLPVASSAGLVGTYFRTDVYLVNPYSWKDVTVRVFFLPTGQDNSGAAHRDILIPSGGSVVLPDVLANTFGASGSGALLMDSSATSNSAFFLASARTYTGDASGTYGLTSEGISSFNEAGYVSLISGVRNGSGFRTNAVAVSTGTTTLSLEVYAYDSAGTLKGSREVSLPPFGHLQVALTDFAGAFDTGYLVWTCSTPSGSTGWAAYAMVIDNASGDSTFVLDRVDDGYTTYRNSFNLAGRWKGAGVLGNGSAGGAVNANVYQNGPFLRVYLYDASTGEQIVNLSGYENQGTVRLSGGGTNYQCLGDIANVQFVASASQLSGDISGTGCFSVHGTVNLTKQSSSATAGEESLAAGPSAPPRGLGVAQTPGR